MEPILDEQEEDLYLRRALVDSGLQARVFVRLYITYVFRNFECVMLCMGGKESLPGKCRLYIIFSFLFLILEQQIGQETEPAIQPSHHEVPHFVVQVDNGTSRSTNDDEGILKSALTRQQVIQHSDLEGIVKAQSRRRPSNPRLNCLSHRKS